MQNEYQNLMRGIHAPEKLERRVMAAAEKKAGPVRRRTGIAAKAVLCTVLALVLVLGSMSWESGEPGEQMLPVPPAVGQLAYSFGLTAYAAGVNGSTILTAGEDGSFRITGEEINTVTLTAEGGTLYRGDTELGGSVTEPYDPAAEYSLRVAEGKTAVLTATAGFSDGLERSSVYQLSAEKLRTVTNEDGTEVLVPALSGDPAETISGLYAVPEESVWFLWPVEGADTVSLSAPYGLRANGAYFHSGIDIPAPFGTAVAAAAEAVVVEAGYEPSRGNYLILDHGDGLTTLYAHCQEVLTEVGAKVTAGEMVALVGATGMATGPHLHFEVRQDGTAQNPVAYLERSVRDTLKMG